jgi:hypothetical protein
MRVSLVKALWEELRTTYPRHVENATSLQRQRYRMSERGVNRSKDPHSPDSLRIPSDCLFLIPLPLLSIIERALTMTYPYSRPHPLVRLRSNTTSSSQANLLVPTSPGGKTRVRRSLSSDSYGFQRDEATVKELMAGQRKAAEEKKGSRHADVIDTWDPTGLGSASE